MNTGAQNFEPMFTPLASQAETGCAEYMLPRGRTRCTTVSYGLYNSSIFNKYLQRNRSPEKFQFCNF